MPKAVSMPAFQVPVVDEVDVLVCGGGPAGTAAAIAAARLGAKTLLVERYNHLGGLATGGQVILIPRHYDTDRLIIAGIATEMRDRLIDSGEAVYRDQKKSSWYFDPEAMKTLSIDMLREAGAGILMHSWCSDAIMEDGELRGAVTLSKAGRQGFLAKIVVDTTGDLDVGESAGAEFEKSDFGIGVCFRLGGVDIPGWQQARREDPDRVQAAHQRFWDVGGWEGFISLTPVATPRTQGDVVWANNQVRTTGDALDPTDLTRIEIDGRDMARRGLEVLRQEMPGYGNAWLIDVACQTGVRYSRRAMGEYVISGDDILEFDFRHPDSVARGNDFRKEGRAFDIPRQSLVSRNVPNLISAGRSLSCDHDALEAIREIHVCWTSGHAAGVIAGMAANTGVAPAAVPIEDLRGELTNQGAVVGGPEA